MSSGAPCRFNAVRACTSSSVSALTGFSDHSTLPGATAFTRTSGPNSRASDLVIITSAALAMQ